MKLFYDHLVDWEEVNTRLQQYNLTSGEKDELLRLLDETITHEVMHHFLEVLPVHVHDTFIVQVKASPHSETHLDFIKHYHPNVEQSITKVTGRSTRRFLDAIHESVIQ